MPLAYSENIIPFHPLDTKYAIVVESLYVFHAAASTKLESVLLRKM